MNNSYTLFHLPARTHGRYLVKERVRCGPSPLLLGFHGYGENAESFLESMEAIPGAGSWLLCSVQALHPFYRRTSGEVVASWMTRLDREVAIRDNTDYVAGVIARLREQFEVGPTVVMCGFSQGVAMAYRAAVCHGALRPSLLILAGDVPPELSSLQLSHCGSVLIGRGKSDEWYSPAKLQDDVQRLRSAGVEVASLEFEGGHEWTAEFNQAAAEFLAQRLERSREAKLRE